MQASVGGRTQLEFVVPARGLIGFRGEFIRLTRGAGDRIGFDRGKVKLSMKRVDQETGADLEEAS